MLLGLGLPALEGVDDEQAGLHAADPGEHVRQEAHVAGHVDEGHDEVVDLGVGEAEVDGQAPGLLLGPAVGVGAGEGQHEGGLAVVDVTGGGDDVQARSPPAVSGGEPRRWPRGSSSAGSTVRRSSSVVSSSTRAMIGVGALRSRAR